MLLQIDNYLTKDRSVITVIPAYRLGLFGYFNLSPSIITSAVKNIQLHGKLLSNT